MSWPFKILPRLFSKATCLVATSCFLCVSASGLLLRGLDDPSGWTLEQWIAWRDHQIGRIFTPTVQAGGKLILSREEVILRSVDAYKVLMPVIAQSDLMSKPGFKTALGNFSRFVRSQSQMAIYDKNGRYTHALGYPITDEAYWAQSAPFLAFPPLLRSREFLSALSSVTTYQRALDLIDEQNLHLPVDRRWITLIYRSGFLKSADTATYGRLLVFVPGETNSHGDLLEKWIQFSLSVPEATMPGKGRLNDLRSVSMVTVSVHSGAVRNSTAYLADFMRTRDKLSGNIQIVPTMLGPKNPSKNCYDCHKSPVLPIHPKATYQFTSKGQLDVSDSDTAAIIEQLNARIVGYGNCALAGMDTGSYGPSIGSGPKERTDPWIRVNSGNMELGGESVARIREAMRCPSCHKGSQSLNYPQSAQTNIGLLIFEQKKGLVQTYVENGWMPPNNTLTPAERTALWRCIDSEYLDSRNLSGTFIDWLKGIPQP